MPQSIMINPHPLGDTRNSAGLPFSATLNGETVWKTTTALKSNPQPARHLAIKDNFLIVAYGPYISLHQRASGKIVWSRQVGANFKFHLTREGLETLDQAGFYRILHFDQSLGAPLSLPFLDRRTFLFYVDSKQNEYRYCYMALPSPTGSPADPVTPPEFTYMRYDVKEDDFLWEYIQKSEIIDVLADAPRGRLIVIGPRALYAFPMNADTEEAVLDRPFAEVQGGSLDSAGNVLVVAREKAEDPFRLIELRSDLTTRWHYDLGRAMTLLQPPCPLPDGSICLIQGKDLINVSSGKRTWATSIPGFSGRAHLTVLKDGDMLIAAGPVLTQFSANGTKRKSVFMEEPVTCRPIVDEDGNIYVAGVQRIYCLK